LESKKWKQSIFEENFIFNKFKIASIGRKSIAFKVIEFDKIREIAMDHYSIYYKLNQNKIGIICFWDNRQDPDNLLEILKKQ
jgi:hypothetical protein